jgi:hypothetical protein
LNDIAATAATDDRPISTAVAHAAPIALLILVPIELLATLIPRGSIADQAVTILTTLALATISWLCWRHGDKPCPRCVRIGQRGGQRGAAKRGVFLRVYHIKRVVVAAAFVVIVGGFSLTMVLGLSGQFQHALWPLKIGVVTAHVLAALLIYGFLAHFAFGQWCPVGEPHPASKSA